MIKAVKLAERLGFVFEYIFPFKSSRLTIIRTKYEGWDYIPVYWWIVQEDFSLLLFNIFNQCFTCFKIIY